MTLRPSVAVAAAVAFALPAAAGTPAQSPAWVPDGDVSALVTAGDTVYLGGDFTRLGAPFGSFAVYAPRGRDPIASMPAFRGPGTISAVETDGAGGWFVGGTFPSFDGAGCANLVHVRRDGTVDGGWCAHVGPISTLYLRRPRLYAVADGTSTVVALDSLTGRRLPWRVTLGQSSTIYPPNVWTVAANDRLVFLGGGFASVNGRPAKRLAAVDARTGRVVWHATVVDGPVTQLLVAGSRLVAVGGFDGVDGRRRDQIAVFDVRDGRLRDWAPNVHYVSRAAIAGRTVFLSYDSTPPQWRERWSARADTTAALSLDTGRPLWTTRRVSAPVARSGRDLLVFAHGALHAVDAATGRPRTWVVRTDRAESASAPGAEAGYRGESVAVSEGRVAVAGDFYAVGAGIARAGLAALDARTGQPLPWAPAVVAPYAGVSALAVSGSEVYVAGEFTRIGGVRRNGLAAVDAVSGAVLPWEPPVRLQPFAGVSSVAVAADAVYVAGEMTVAGRERHAAAFDPVTGAALPWNAAADDQVEAIASSPTAVFLGGRFERLHGNTAPYLAAVDPVTGAPTAWRPRLDGEVSALAVDGSTLYVGGEFETAAGEPRRHVAAFDLTTGAVTQWQPRGDVGSRVDRIVVDATTVWVDGVPYTRDTGARKPWPSLGGMLVAPTATSVYATAQNYGGLVAVPAPS